jgi:hypothetical protein
MSEAAANSTPIRQDGTTSLFITSGAMFLGLAGVFLFAAPGGVIGAVCGALVGAACAHFRLKPGD